MYIYISSYILKSEFKETDFSEIAAVCSEQILDEFIFSKNNHLALCTPRVIDILLSIPSGVHDTSFTPSLPQPQLTARKPPKMETNHVHHVIQLFSFSCELFRVVVYRVRFEEKRCRNAHVFKTTGRWKIFCLAMHWCIYVLNKTIYTPWI